MKKKERKGVTALLKPSSGKCDPEREHIASDITNVNASSMMRISAWSSSIHFC
jgi:hypothetical protein